MNQAKQQNSALNKSKLFRNVLKNTTRTVSKYNLIEEDDRILVCVSGGKDSLCMLSILQEMKRKAPFNFDIIAYTLDQGQPDFQKETLSEHYSTLGVEWHIEHFDTYKIVQEKLDSDQTQCFLCSRMRRGILYSEAKRLNANKLALGHHADDAIETLLMNLFYTGRLAGIAPELLNDAEDMTVIRPLMECLESDLGELAEHLNLPVINCTVCGSQENLNRQRIKRLISDEAKSNPYIRSSMKKAMQNVQMRHLWQPPEKHIENEKSK